MTDDGNSTIKVEGLAPSQVKTLLKKQLDHAKTFLTKKSEQDAISMNQKNRQPEKDENLFAKFLHQSPLNGSEAKVLGFMREVLFKYFIYVSFHETSGLVNRGENITEGQNRCIQTLFSQPDDASGDPSPVQAQPASFLHSLSLQ